MYDVLMPRGKPRINPPLTPRTGMSMATSVLLQLRGNLAMPYASRILKLRGHSRRARVPSGSCHEDRGTSAISPKVEIPSSWPPNHASTAQPISAQLRANDCVWLHEPVTVGSMACARTPLFQPVPEPLRHDLYKSSTTSELTRPPPLVRHVQQSFHQCVYLLTW